MAECQWENCTEPSRAKGLCENHYRLMRRRAQGVNARHAHDDVIWKVRIRLPQGAQPYYYSIPQVAYEKAKEALRDGTLEFFGEYRFERMIEVEENRRLF